MRNGKRIKLSNGRRLVDEVIRTSNKMQMGSFSRDFDLRELNELRKKVRPKNRLERPLHEGVRDHRPAKSLAATVLCWLSVALRLRAQIQRLPADDVP